MPLCCGDLCVDGNMKVLDKGFHLLVVFGLFGRIVYVSLVP